MSNIFDNDLINFVKACKVPKKDAKKEDMHILYPIANINEDKGVNKKQKKKSNENNNKENKKRKSSSVIKTNEQNYIDKTNEINKKNRHHKHHHKSTKDSNYKEKTIQNDKYLESKKDDGNYFYFINEIKSLKEKMKKEEMEKKEKKLKKEKKEKEKIDLCLQQMLEQNNRLKTKLRGKQEIMEKHKKIYETQENMIKDLEFIYNEMKNNNTNSNKNDYDLNNNINELYNFIDDYNDDFKDDYNEDIIYNEDLQEELAIKAVEQQILDELCPNPDTMSYEQLLQLEDNLGSVNKGLSNEQIDKLPLTKFKKKKFTENYQCIICMEEFEEKEKVKLLPCGHIFHDNCIKQWLLKQKTCPFCKDEIR